MLTREHVEYGCHVDGHLGVYAYDAIYALARTFEIEVTEDDERALRLWHDGVEMFTPTDWVHECDTLAWVVDTTDDMLVTLTEKAGGTGTWGWHDGEVFFEPDEWWEEV